MKFKTPALIAAAVLVTPFLGGVSVDYVTQPHLRSRDGRALISKAYEQGRYTYDDHLLYSYMQESDPIDLRIYVPLREKLPSGLRARFDHSVVSLAIEGQDTPPIAVRCTLADPESCGLQKDVVVGTGATALVTISDFSASGERLKQATYRFRMKRTLRFGSRFWDRAMGV